MCGCACKIQKLSYCFSGTSFALCAVRSSGHG